MDHMWLRLEKADIATERRQLIEEGRDGAALADAFAILEDADSPSTPAWREEANLLLDRSAMLPMRDDFAYDEPDKLDAIQERREGDGANYPLSPPSDKVWQDKVLGAWQGRCSGCLLGKPVEGLRSAGMWGFLRELGQYPLDGYFRSDTPEEIQKKHGISFFKSCCIDQVRCMPADDDLNYTVLALMLMDQFGPDFTSDDVANAWLSNLPILFTCTAERIAYRNLIHLMPPPESARYRNPYREWIGAMIRADAYGYVAPGDPERAARFAWRDARVSHVKNGLYGAMWVAAMNAAAAVESSPEAVIRAGLAQIPARCRLAEAILTVLDWHKEGIDAEQAVARIHTRWDEHDPHDWCHVISNAQVVAFGLLWGALDFGRSICLTVHACFDTDCNGATVGSLVGMMLGSKQLPEDWIAPLNDTVQTDIARRGEIRISDLARQTVSVAHRFRPGEDT